MRTYVAFLRGINVGGNSLIKMADLKDALTTGGITDVRTYIQSGNVIFSSSTTSTDALATTIKSAISHTFNLEVGVVVFSKDSWRRIIKAAPSWWGVDKTRKHNLLILIPPYDMPTVLEALGNLKTDIESVETGDGVIYQSLSLKKFGQTSSSKLVSSPVYKQMTIRNFNTATKLLSLLA